MSPEKRKSVDYSRKNIENFDSIHTFSNEDLAEISMRKFKDEICVKYDYIYTQFLFSLSNRWGRIFSAARRALTDFQKVINPTNFEHQMFIYANRDL